MTERCFHCNENVPVHFNEQVLFDGKYRCTCCVGCQFIMQAVIDSGLSDYYRFRTEPAVLGVLPSDLEAELDTLRMFDEPEFTQQILVEPSEDVAANSNEGNKSVAMAEVTLSVEGVRCGACVWLLERTLGAIPGIETVSVNGSTHRARVRFDLNTVALSHIFQRIQQIGYQALPLDVAQHEQRLVKESRRQIQRLFVAGIAMMQVMMYALPGYLSTDSTIAPAHLHLLNWAGMVLTIPVMVFSAVPFFQGALRSIRAGSVGMDVPVSIGIFAAFGSSVWSVLNQQGESYFDSVSMFVFLLLLARYVEWSIRCRSVRSMDDINNHNVDTAHLLTNGEIKQVPAARLKVGDTIRVNSGDTVPVDGTIISGQTTMDCSVISGESKPVVATLGDNIPGGAVVAGNPVELQVQAIQQYSTLSLIAKLVERGAADKPALVTSADRIAHYFVWCLLGFATLVFIVWWVIEPTRAVAIAITVMVVSCPCALSLATPAALCASTSSLLGVKLFITRGHVLETLANVTDIVFDKTGTLTHGKPKVASVDYVGNLGRDETLAIAAALEEGAAHPFARAICELNKTSKNESESANCALYSKPSLQAIEHSAGEGICAVWTDELDHSRYLRIGSKAWCRLTDVTVDQLEQRFPLQCKTASRVYLCQSDNSDFSEPQVIARFSLADSPRQEAAEVVAQLKQRGLNVHLLSGDQADVVEQCAAALEIHRWCANARPEQKQDYVAALQAKGTRVMMIGDGINDAPVLANADVSVAIGEATSLARTSADVIALGGELSVLLRLLKQARRTVRIVKQNLMWALIYNVTVIPAAALGLVSPWLAAIGMAASSLLVAANAARLWFSNHTPQSLQQAHTKGEIAWNH